MERFVRLNRTVVGSGRLIPLSDLEDRKILNSYLSADPEVDWYTSLFYFGPDAKALFDANNSIAGYTGVALTNKLVFDLDCKNNLDQARLDTIEVLNRLKEEGVNVRESAVVYFSGGKGFHLEIPIDKELTPSELKTICSGIAGDLVSFDTSIYNTTRLFRLANTKHNVTGLYKIAFSPSEFAETGVAAIKELATKPRELEYIATTVTELGFLEKYKKPIEHKKPTLVVVDGDLSGIRGLETMDFTKCPRHVPRCIYALSQGIMVPGERSRILFRLATYYRNQGMPKEVTHRALKGICELNSKLYPEADLISKDEIWTQHIASAYSDNATVRPGGYGSSEDNELLVKYCNAIKSDMPCLLHSKNKTNMVMKIDDVSNSFETFARHFDDNIVRTGIDFIDENMKMTVGTTTLLVGATGSGKTTVALNMMENANRLGQYTMFFSLDMHKNLIYLKLAQKLTNYSQDEVLSFYKSGDQRRIKEIRAAIAHHYDKTFFDFSSTLTIEEMRDRVLAAEEKSNQKIKLVVVDYASRISGPHSDAYSNARYNALRSVEVANVTDAAWIFINQISRNVGNGMTPLRTKRAAKESGDWEESASNVITMWRPFMGIEGQDDVIRMFMAKNRLGREIERPLLWDGAKATIRDFNEEERILYEEERQTTEQAVLKNALGLNNGK